MASVLKKPAVLLWRRVGERPVTKLKFERAYSYLESVSAGQKTQRNETEKAEFTGIGLRFIPPRGDLSMLFNEPEIQYKYKNIVDNTQDEPGDSICCKQKKRFWILLRMILQRVLEKLHVR
ncbi:hypothetical protein NQ317_019322 [Molorchus minor]|uniref:Uncharacterized protein n=1 Tax=Molorchus minor TaxID=1323400 RepID=A0ABQ9IVP8_9CUCU|nr:hypothetical protein NQ317_019322 [Molorchus minor]